MPQLNKSSSKATEAFGLSCGRYSSFKFLYKYLWFSWDEQKSKLKIKKIIKLKILLLLFLTFFYNLLFVFVSSFPISIKIFLKFFALPKISYARLVTKNDFLFNSVFTKERFRKGLFLKLLTQSPIFSGIDAPTRTMFILLIIFFYLKLTPIYSALK